MIMHILQISQTMSNNYHFNKHRTVHTNFGYYKRPLSKCASKYQQITQALDKSITYVPCWYENKAQIYVIIIKLIEINGLLNSTSYRLIVYSLSITEISVTALMFWLCIA